VPLTLQTRIASRVAGAIGDLWSIEPPEVVLNHTPSLDYGEWATPVCLGLARTLRQAPKAIAGALVEALSGGLPEGVRKVEVAGPGYINFYLDRASVFRSAFAEAATGRFAGFGTASGEKVIVEHTNINPNKAAHIGHLRNAAIGDAFVRMLRLTGRRVEVQNYIDNTGVQVADVIVGFIHIENRTPEDVRALIADTGGKFDYYCWDLYAKAAAWYETRDRDHATRGRVLQEIEAGGNATAGMAEDVAMAIVRCHLRTMERIGVRYDLLPRESDILHLKFWERAFSLLKERKAVLLETEGKNAGCWVMPMGDPEGGASDDKIIVRSNGTATYVGKDIAYQLWKLGRLDLDFRYQVLDRYPDGEAIWVSTSGEGAAEHPAFGRGREIYNVIDVRQSYPQTVVKEGVRALGYAEDADRSIHFSYEMVALTPECAGQLGVVLSEADRRKPFVEVSGRKGQGVKADDLLDALEAKALGEVGRRNPDLPDSDQKDIAHQIAVGALRYFLLRFTRNAIIAFDFDEALNFDGDTGPYVQYAAVRANNILRKVAAELRGAGPAVLQAGVDSPRVGAFLASDELWELVLTAARIDETVAQAVGAMEPATLCRHAFLLAQKFNLFYHKYRVLAETDPERRLFLAATVEFSRTSLARVLDLIGIAVPIRM
jgi:arginyl-tRNA synthetase